MNFIERFLGISPDGGNGFAEAACITVCVMGVLMPILRIRLSHLFRPQRNGAHLRLLN